MLINDPGNRETTKVDSMLLFVDIAPVTYGRSSLPLKVNDMSQEYHAEDLGFNTQISRGHCSHLKQVSMLKGKKLHRPKGKASIGSKHRNGSLG